MSVTDFVWISVGQITLAATFALGILVGCALQRKDSANGNGNEGTARSGQKDWNHWYGVERR